MKILVICGSPREKSYTRVLTKIAFDYAKSKNYDVTYLDLGKINIEKFRGLEEKYDKTTEDVVKLVESSDIFIIGSPIYNGVFSSVIKNLFEFVNYKTLEGRVAGFIIMSSGTISYLQVQGQLQSMMNYFRVISNPRSVFVSTNDFDENMKLKNKEIKSRIEKLVEETINLKERH
jgi:FMN reductase/FAD reductase [NAD(P)H]